MCYLELNQKLTYRLYSQCICQSPDQCAHGLDIVIDSPEQHSLVTNRDSRIAQSPAGLFSNPRDLIRMIEMRVKSHPLARLLGLLADVYEGIGPLVIRVEKAIGAHRQPLGGKAEFLDVGHVDQFHANLDKVFWPDKE